MEAGHILAVLLFLRVHLWGVEMQGPCTLADCHMCVDLGLYGRVPAANLVVDMEVAKWTANVAVVEASCYVLWDAKVVVEPEWWCWLCSAMVGMVVAVVRELRVALVVA